MNPFSFPSIAIDISDESFKYLRLKRVGGVYDVDFFGEHNLNPGLVESGDITDVDSFSHVLAEHLKPFRRKYPYCALSLPEEKGFLRLISIQRVPKDEVRQALEFQIEEHIPYPPEELTFDYKVLPEQGPEGEINIIVTAYPTEVVEKYLTAVRSAGFYPVLFELESQAVARATVGKHTREATLVGDIGKTRTTFSIVWRGTTYFTSTIQVGGRDIDKILESALQVTPEEASKLKIKRGFDMSSDEIIHTLKPMLDQLYEEADRQLQFWQRHIEHGDSPITRVLLCGGDAHLQGMPEYLEQRLNIPVSRAEVWSHLFDVNSQVPILTAHDTLLYTTALGLAMRSDRYLFGDV